MKRILLIAAAALLLCGCAARENEDRADAIQRKYAAADGYTARVEVDVARRDETAHYALDVSRSGDTARVTVVRPEELAGVGAVMEGDELSLAYDGMVLDAGSMDETISAVNAADVALRAVAEGWITERNRERWEDVDALRLRFETDFGGETLYAAVWFNGQDMPLHAEIEHDGKILADLEFTDFAFGDILPDG